MSLTEGNIISPVGCTEVLNYQTAICDTLVHHCKSPPQLDEINNNIYIYIYKKRMSMCVCACIMVSSAALR
ncbi:unnamed protein product [Coffea canephora]|uniref:Uncharacterized protein n=1 Tax=Coffea canephora TaxID=49390 RepID=A0A068UPJ9_COFCA|nr:unnamed protein product [Coffea canephora]